MGSCPLLPAWHRRAMSPTYCMSQTSVRNPWLDATKGLACLAIVAHHLAVYGPMSNTVRPYAPQLMAWLFDYARMAVQVFLVLGGYLAAKSLAPAGVARFDSAATQIARRFVRLSVPYAAALLVAVAAAALVRPWLDDPSVPDSPHFAQLLANALMLQDVLGKPALSAGVWYVAIDFQLYAIAALLLAFSRRTAGNHSAWAACWSRGLILLACGASLLVFNRLTALDVWGIYFFGSYGLGMATWWAVQSRRPLLWMLGIAMLGALALTLDFRSRIALALATSAWLAWVALRAQVLSGSSARSIAAPLAWVGTRAYSVFLVHFPVCLAVNAAFGHIWPEQAGPQAVGLFVAFALSIVAGCLLYERVERHGVSAWQAMRWEARLLGGSLLVALTHGGL